MTANEALAGLRTKFAAKGLPPGIIQAIIEAVMGLFKQFCPTLSPPPAGDLQAIAKSGLAAYQADDVTRDRIVLRRHLRRGLGFFSRHLDRAEGCCWEVGSEASQREVVQYTAAWQDNRSAIEDSE